MTDLPSPGETDHEHDLQPIRPDVASGSEPEDARPSDVVAVDPRGAAVPDSPSEPVAAPEHTPPSPHTGIDVADLADAEIGGAASVSASSMGATPVPGTDVSGPEDGPSPSASVGTPSSVSIDDVPIDDVLTDDVPTQTAEAPAHAAETPAAASSNADPTPSAAAEHAVPPGAPARTSVRAPDLVSDVVRPLPRVMAVANQKGGVGKTTTTVNLGASLAELDYRVLVVDLDPQGNATTGLGINPRTLEYTMYDILLNDVSLDECIEPTEVKGLFVAPASLDLAGAEVELVSTLSRESRLKRALAEVIDDYDYVLIDCPPSLGLLTVNALAAATEVLVPIQCEYYALEGLGQLTRNVDLIQRNLNPDLEISAIVLVMYDARTRLGEQVATEVRAHFGPKVCRNVIPRNVRLSEAPSFGKPINTFDPSSRGAVAYRELAREVSGGS